LRDPDRFAAAATLSGALDIPALLRDPERREELVDRVFGADLDPAEDLFALLESAGDEPLPLLHVSCGTEDHLVDHSRRFAEAATRAGAEVTVDLRPGEHEWGFWDTEIQRVLGWLPLDVKG
jgi:S-formylglutathione hydrolase FrmB